MRKRLATLLVSMMLINTVFAETPFQGHAEFDEEYSSPDKELFTGKTETLEKFGAVSEECAYEMAFGLQKLTGADVCISTTGIAGPTGGSKEKPVGLMYFTIYTKEKSETFKVLLPSQTPRRTMKEGFVLEVLEKVYTFLLFI